jgi:hypothetical protein
LDAWEGDAEFTVDLPSIGGGRGGGRGGGSGGGISSARRDRTEVGDAVVTGDGGGARTGEAGTTAGSTGPTAPAAATTSPSGAGANPKP